MTRSGTWRRCGGGSLLLGLALAAPAQQRNVSGGPLRPEQACFDVLHYTLHLDVDEVGKTIAGTLAMRAKWLAAAPELQLDLDEALAVQSLQLDGADVPYERQGGLLHVRPAKALAVGAREGASSGQGCRMTLVNPFFSIQSMPSGD